MSSYASSTIAGFVGNVSITNTRAAFGIAVRYFKDGPLHWLQCVTFKPELIALVRQYVHKGRFILVEGRPEVRVWEKNGTKLSRDVHVLNRIVLLPQQTYDPERLPNDAFNAPDADLGEPILDPPTDVEVADL